MIVALVWLSVALTGLALMFAVFNRFTWPRGDPDHRWPGRISILIPARNEARNLGPCIAALQRSTHPFQEVIVYDDASTDGTAALLEELRGRVPGLRVIPGGPLPTGWIGKTHACHQLARAASGDLFIFLDADVRMSPSGISRVVSLFHKVRADVVTAVPAQELGSLAEKLVLPLLHLTYLSWFPLILVYRSQNPRFLAANGQVLAVKRTTYNQTGGFSNVRAEIVDDMAFCRAAKKAGQRIVFADGHLIARCRMYDSARAIVQGFSKNLYEGLNERPGALAAVLILYLSAFVGPYVALGVGWAAPDEALVVAGGMGVILNTLLRVIVAQRHEQPVSGVVFHPVAVLVFVGIAVNSACWSWRGTLKWRGRAYPRRSKRHRTATPPRTAPGKLRGTLE